MLPKRVLTLAQQPSFWALVALVFVAFLLAWVYRLSIETNRLADENRQAVRTLKSTQDQLTAAIKHQCATDAAHDVAVREFIRKEKDLDVLAALLGLHYLLIDVSTCREVTG